MLLVALPIADIQGRFLIFGRMSEKIAANFLKGIKTTYL